MSVAAFCVVRPSRSRGTACAWRDQSRTAGDRTCRLPPRPWEPLGPKCAARAASVRGSSWSSFLLGENGDVSPPRVSAAASVDQRKVLDLLARRVGRHRRCGLLGWRSPRCDERHGCRQAQGGRCESDSEDTGDFAHENLHQAAGRVPGGIWGVISHGRDERLEGEVELIWISLESFWRFPENGMMGPLFGGPEGSKPSPTAQKLRKLNSVGPNGRRATVSSSSVQTKF